MVPRGEAPAAFLFVTELRASFDFLEAVKEQ